jgi:hypothetical protein
MFGSREKKVPALAASMDSFWLRRQDTMLGRAHMKGLCEEFLVEAMPSPNHSGWRPMHFDGMRFDMANAREVLEKHLKDLPYPATSYREICNWALMDNLTLWKTLRADDWKYLPLQRAAAIANYLEVDREYLEVLIGFMRYGDVDPVFGFSCASELARRRKEIPRKERGNALSRKETEDWFRHVLSSTDDFSKDGAGMTLVCIQRQLGNWEFPIPQK